jgi:CHAT domain-containing protein
MAEKYCLSYVPSAVSAQLIKNRNFPSTRKDLIAFGGAVYEDESVPSVYSELGIKSWQPLPGSLEEVKEIGELFSDSNVYTGTQATESKIKELSKEKSLAAYKIIHLAAHGLILPETPELSAVVLSQGSRFNSREHGMDGYLSMQEILDLDLAADFVNLSACETGLGRLYGGEGIVGLTQAVILAGAKSVSASLWQVADKSTAAFMAGVYRLVLESGISYKEAITEIKRQFIRSENYSHPFFWAPFVYYGM